MLDTNRPGAEILVQDGNVCLTREDFLSLGLPQFMESNVSILKFWCPLYQVSNEGTSYLPLLHFVTDWKRMLQTREGSRPKMCTFCSSFHLLKHRLCTCRGRPLRPLFFQIVLTSSETCVVQFFLDIVVKSRFYWSHEPPGNKDSFTWLYFASKVVLSWWLPWWMPWLVKWIQKTHGKHLHTLSCGEDVVRTKGGRPNYASIYSGRSYRSPWITTWCPLWRWGEAE